MDEPKIDTHLSGAITNLLENLNDKDDTVRNTIEYALVKISEKQANDVLHILCDYKAKAPKLGEAQTAVILRIIENLTTQSDKMANVSESIVKQLIDLSITELTRNNDSCIQLQKPALEILVSIGRHQCHHVMDALIKQLQSGHVAHFMILHCMGTLATANIKGIIEFIKPVFVLILPTLSMIKPDHIKQAYSFAIGRFCEAIIEYFTNETGLKDNELSRESYGTEISIAYDVLLHQWLPSREPKVCCDILYALSLMFPLLPHDKVREQIGKVIPSLLSLYRRSIDRIAITQLLASVLKTIIKLDPKMLDPLSDTLIGSLFDLVCVTPDYEKPQTVKGHYEVLRCFDLLSEIFSSKIMDMLLVQLRSNNERERIKSLLLLTHLTNTSHENISSKIKDFIAVLKQMIQTEKIIKIKMVILKTIVAFIEKSFISDTEFIKFIIRHCCHYNKFVLEYGSVEEYTGFVEACNNSMFILSSTVGTIDELLKSELLQHFMLLDYTDACSTIARCLSNLFQKNLEFVPGQFANGDSPVKFPPSEAIFVRSLILLGNFNERQRSKNILNFLKHYCSHLNKHLVPLWGEKVLEILLIVSNTANEMLYYEKLYEFVQLTIKDIDDPKFPEILINKIVEQTGLYVNLNANNNHVQNNEFKIPNMINERGMMLKLLGLCLCYHNDIALIESKIDFIINCVKLEKLEKISPNSEYEYRLSDAARSLGYIARKHYDFIIKKLEALVDDEMAGKAKGSGFFSGLNFIKDAHKDIEIYKLKLLLIEGYGYIVKNSQKHLVYNTLNVKLFGYVLKQLAETKDFTIKKLTMNSLAILVDEFLAYENCESINFTEHRDEIIKILIQIPIEPFGENVQLFPLIIRLATNLIKINYSYTDNNMIVNEILHVFCHNFFQSAQQLKTKFASAEDDERNSLLAKYLNQTLPELNLFIRQIIEKIPLPSSLDDVNTILEIWLKDKNSEVRICAGHILNNSLDVYIKTMKLGYDAPSKFNQTGSMIGKIVPRCIDSNATVRQTSIDILRKILEISCIYDTLTIADNTNEWVIELEKIHDQIITDDPKEIYRFASDIANVIGQRLSNFQYLQFCKTLLYSMNDPEQSSAIGASVVLKFFIQNKGADLFHAIPELVKESLHIVKYCENVRAKAGILKALVGLTKHHPKNVCNEILGQNLPFEEHIVEYWQTIALDLELTAIILDNFLNTLNTSCLYEQDDGKDNNSGHNRQKIATQQPFAIICALREMFVVNDVTPELKSRFANIFSMLLTTLATYTNLAPPLASGKVVTTPVQPKSLSAKFGFNAATLKMNPCQIVLDTFILFLGRLEMEQVSVALTLNNDLPGAQDLGKFMEILTPLATGLANQLSINSSSMKQVITAFSKYVSSPYDPQRIAALGFYSQLVPLKPCGEISSVIVLHLHSSLNDPNALVRGLCIRGLAFIGNLTQHDIDKYSEMGLTSLLKGIDDYNGDCLINIPLESMKGLSRILKSIPCDKLDMFQVSMSIRIRPFFENSNVDIREAAIILFGDLCQTKYDTDMDSESHKIPDALKEQLYTNLVSLLLHLGEPEQRIVRASKYTLREMCALLNTPKITHMARDHLIDYQTLNYDSFVYDFVKLFGEELSDHINDFIDHTFPYLKSAWPELRGNAAIIIGILYNFVTTNQPQLDVGYKISQLLKDDSNLVRIKTAKALSYIFGEI